MLSFEYQRVEDKLADGLDFDMEFVMFVEVEKLVGAVMTRGGDDLRVGRRNLIGLDLAG